MHAKATVGQQKSHNCPQLLETASDLNGDELPSQTPQFPPNLHYEPAWAVFFTDSILDSLSRVNLCLYTPACARWWTVTVEVTRPHPPCPSSLFNPKLQAVRVHRGRGGNRAPAEERTPGKGAKVDGHPSGGPQLRSPPGPDPRGHEPHAGEVLPSH